MCYGYNKKTQKRYATFGGDKPDQWGEKGEEIGTYEEGTQRKKQSKATLREERENLKETENLLKKRVTNRTAKWGHTREQTMQYYKIEDTRFASKEGKKSIRWDDQRK